MRSCYVPIIGSNCVKRSAKLSASLDTHNGTKSAAVFAIL